MTAFFVQKFKSATKCAHCKKDKISGYSLCPTHLELARARFASWSKERRSIGRCILCDRRARLASRGSLKGVNRELRCSRHAEINRQRIARWIAKHPNHSHEVWLKSKARYKDCREARHVRPRGSKVCGGCSLRQRYNTMQAQQPAM